MRAEVERTSIGMRAEVERFNGHMPAKFLKFCGHFWQRDCLAAEEAARVPWVQRRHTSSGHAQLWRCSVAVVSLPRPEAQAARQAGSGCR